VLGDQRLADAGGVSAHWCGPCRTFTPQLAETYKKVKAGPHADDFEIVFVSSDSDQKAFDSYFAEMPWLAVPYENRALKDDLSAICEVEGIPTLVIVGPDGKVINPDGRAALAADKAGTKYPWRPPPYSALEECSGINDSPTLVAFVEGLDDADAGDAEAEVEKFAKKQIASAVAAGGEPPELQVAIAKAGDSLAARLRTLMKLPAPTDDPVLAIVDLQDEKSFYVAKADGAAEVTTSKLAEFARAFTAGELKSERQTLDF
jgi:nucleoredoxin